MGGNTKTGRRRFGRIRKLPSGRWQARYKGPDGIDRPAARTFATKRDAEVWLTRTEADILDDNWLDPDLGQVTFGNYAGAWIDERPGLRPKTLQLYRYLLRQHLNPAFDTKPVAAIREPHVRRWRKQLLDTGTSAVTVAKAYRLLKAILTTAADDGVIRRNPCRIKGAGQEKSPERPVLTIPQVFALADAIGQRYRALVLLAVFGSLRWGELAALRRCDIDVDARTVSVTRQLTEVSGYLAFGPPKSDAGKRIIVVPALIVPDLRWHLSCFAQPGDDGLLFTSPTGMPLRHGHFRSRVWVKALKQAGLPALHFHDLRHAGNMLTAATGATLRELMDRMGHSTARAALIYQHGSHARQHEIADALGQLAKQRMTDSPAANKGKRGKPTGTGRARRGPQAS
jgi:integrase